jgi:hypothetical protein
MQKATSHPVRLRAMSRMLSRLRRGASVGARGAGDTGRLRPLLRRPAVAAHGARGRAVHTLRTGVAQIQPPRRGGGGPRARRCRWRGRRCSRRAANTQADQRRSAAANGPPAGARRGAGRQRPGAARRGGGAPVVCVRRRGPAVRRRGRRCRRRRRGRQRQVVPGRERRFAGVRGAAEGHRPRCGRGRGQPDVLRVHQLRRRAAPALLRVDGAPRRPQRPLDGLGRDRHRPRARPGRGAASLRQHRDQSANGNGPRAVWRGELAARGTGARRVEERWAWPTPRRPAASARPRGGGIAALPCMGRGVQSFAPGARVRS